MDYSKKKDQILTPSNSDNDKYTPPTFDYEKALAEGFSITFPDPFSAPTQTSLDVTPPVQTSNTPPVTNQPPQSSNTSLAANQAPQPSSTSLVTNQAPQFRLTNNSLNESEKLNYEAARAFIETQKKLTIAQGLANIDVNKKLAINKGLIDQELYRKYRLMELKQRHHHYNFTSQENEQYNSEKSPFKSPPNIDLYNSFITHHSIIKKQNHSNISYFYWDEELSHHIKIRKPALKSLYAEFAEKNCPMLLSSDQSFNKEFQKLLNHIPRKSKSDIKDLPPHSVLFKNGILDVSNFSFMPLCINELKRYYSDFCINIDYTYSNDEPSVFNQLLNDISGNDPAIEDLLCEQMGAAICQNSPQKKIFVFQGFRNGGKTRLLDILARLVSENDSLRIPTISDLEPPPSSPIRFVHVQELGKNRLSDKAVALLKGYADGSNLSDNTSFKIFLCTNHPIITDDNNQIQPALEDRLSIVPFKKEMQNADPVSNFERSYLQQERLSIIIKCLRHYQKVLQNHGHFSHHFPPNKCIDLPKNTQNVNKKNNNLNIDSTSSVPNISAASIIKLKFVLTDEPNSEMTPKKIMDIVNPELSEMNKIKSNEQVGILLNKVFKKEKLKHRKLNGITTIYNIKLIDPSDPSKDTMDTFFSA